MVSEMMKVFRVAFYFICGWIVVLAVLMALLTMLYVANVAIEDAFHINVIDWIVKKIHGKI